jgi:hypothetical protein
VLLFIKFGFIAAVFVRVLYTLSTRRWRAGKPVEIAGQACGCNIRRGKYRRVQRISFDLPLPDRQRFVLRLETRYDRFATKVGLAREWQTGDASLDERVFVVCEDSVFNDALLANRELRAACAALFAQEGVQAIECARGRLYVDFVPPSDFVKADDDVLQREFGDVLVPLLLRLRDRLNGIASGEWEASRDPSLARRSLLVGVCVAIGVVGVVMAISSSRLEWRQMVEDSIDRHALWVTLTIAGALLGALFLWLRITPHTHGVLLDVLLAGIPGAWLAAQAGYRMYDQRADEARPRHIAVTVQSTTDSRGSRGSHSYYLTVESWPDSRAAHRIQVRREVFVQFRGGDCMYVDWHAGALGDAWIDGFERGDPNCKPGEF